MLGTRERFGLQRAQPRSCFAAGHTDTLSLQAGMHAEQVAPLASGVRGSLCDVFCGHWATSAAGMRLY